MAGAPEAATSCSERTSRQHGRTIVEMLVTVAVIVIVASVATPSSDSREHEVLMTAGAVTAEALRYARDQAALTRVVHGVEIDTEAQRIRLFQLDTSTVPATKLFDVDHPMTKSNYALNFDARPYVGTRLSGLDQQTTSTCRELTTLVFSLDGMVRCPDPLTSRFLAPAITLENSRTSLTIQIDPYTGRVSTL